MRRPDVIGVAHPHAEVGVLHQQPATRREPGGHASQRIHALRQLDENRACVDQVERTLGELVDPNVVAEHLQVRERELSQEIGLQVGGGHPAARPDLAAQPACDLAAAGADLQAAGTGSEPEAVDATDRGRVQPLLKELEAPALVAIGMRKRISRRDVGHRAQQRHWAAPYR